MKCGKKGNFLHISLNKKLLKSIHFTAMKKLYPNVLPKTPNINIFPTNLFSKTDKKSTKQTNCKDSED